jgi:hypothetical protein
MADEQQAHLGTPGASALLKARRLHEQRQSLNASRTSLARLAAALFPPKIDKHLRQEEHNWTTGARGEQNLASSLARRCPNVPMLHDRRAHGSRGNIDHIAIAPSGVYVIDCKRYKGKIEVAQPLLGKAKLKINGRDSTSLIDGVDKQVGQVRAAIAEVANDVPVHGSSASSPRRGSSQTSTSPSSGHSKSAGTRSTTQDALPSASTNPGRSRRIGH